MTECGAQGGRPPDLRRSTIAARFWMIITRDDGFDRTITNLLPSGEMSKPLCGLVVTMPSPGKSTFRDVTVSAGVVAMVAAIIAGSARESAFIAPREIPSFPPRLRTDSV